MISVLFISADPSNLSRLRLGEEFREIQEKLQLSKLRSQFVLSQRTSVRPSDISQALLDTEPYIVHFCGHGKSTGGLYFENKIGEAQLVQPEALAELFGQFSTKVNCVILNACYSALQAKAITKNIPYVIGMDRAISDKAAIAFSVGFYQALGAGRSIEEAFKFGCVQIRLEGIAEHLIPVLFESSEIRQLTDKITNLLQQKTSIKTKFEISDYLVAYTQARKISLNDIILAKEIEVYFKQFFIPSLINPSFFQNKITLSPYIVNETKLPPRQILLQGPVGTGKTMLVNAIAFETGFPLFHLRRGLDKEIIFFCSTNCPKRLDPIFVARMHCIELGLPDQECRERLVQKYFDPKVVVFEPGLSIEEVAKMLYHRSPLEIRNCFQELLVSHYEIYTRQNLTHIMLTREWLTQWVERNNYGNEI